ncbi:MAG: hypothetical protein U0694_21445 [Anaerolineae bacterium]
MTTQDQRRRTTTSENEAVQHFSEAERSAMRAYIQRCEVRLGTLHRIATALISGAGLMVLIPVFFKDAVSGLIQTMLRNFLPILGSEGLLIGLGLYISLGLVFYLLLFIPLRALYLLFKDIIDFYFGIHTPGFPESVQNPSFAFTAVAFSPDESPNVKREMLRYQYQQSSIDFLLPFSSGKRTEYFTSFEQDPELDAIEAIRDPHVLRREGLVGPDVSDDDIRHFNAAFAIMRAVDRSLVEEVAKTEMSLVRHVMYLRRVVLRYVKATLVFVWTLLVLLAIDSFIKAEIAPPFILLSAGCLVWSLPVTWIMHMPIEWIYRPITRVKDRTVKRKRLPTLLKIIADLVIGPKIEEDTDKQLVIMEESVKTLRHAAVVLSVIALLLALYTWR